MESTQGLGPENWTTNDEAAVAEARSGNPDAFRVLVDRHGRSVFRLAYRMTANQQDAEDVVQETFLRACKQLDRFDGRASFGTWLFRIATNCSLDLLRARSAREQRILEPLPPRSDGDLHAHPLDHLPAADPSPERLSLSNEVGRLLAPAMGQLSQMERAAFVLRHHEGLSVDEISRALNVRPNAAKHSIFRAVQKLRRVLEPRLGGASATTLRTTS